MAPGENEFDTPVLDYQEFALYLGHKGEPLKCFKWGTGKSTTDDNSSINIFSLVYKSKVSKIGKYLKQLYFLNH